MSKDFNIKELMNSDNSDFKFYNNQDLLDIIIELSQDIGQWHHFLRMVDWSSGEVFSAQQTLRQLTNLRDNVKNELNSRF